MAENTKIPNGEIIIYQTDGGKTKIDVKVEDETVWLTQAQIVELYQTSKANVSEHIKHIFEDGELEENSVVRKFRTTAADGKAYNTTYYNLDMIISLGYRIRSITATHFRKWATAEYRKYQVQTLSPVEEEYLQTIKSVEKETKTLLKKSGKAAKE